MYPKDKHVYIIDSLGPENEGQRPYDDIMYDVLDDNGFTHDFYPYAYQYENNSMCGWFAIYAAKLINENKNKNPYKLIYDVFDDIADDGDIKHLMQAFGMNGGELDKKYDGAGLLDGLVRHFKGIKKALSGTRDNLKYSVRKHMETYGNKQIKSMIVVRNPIALNTFIKIIQKFVPSSVSHDKLFHLFVVCTLEDGTHIRLEKNQDINTDIYKQNKLDESIPVDMNNQQLTMNKLIENTKKLMGEKNFYHYSALTYNCQNFVYNLLKANGLSADTNFIMQNVNGLVPTWVDRLMQFATDTKNRLDMAITGYGIKQTNFY